MNWVMQDANVQRPTRLCGLVGRRLPLRCCCRVAGLLRLRLLNGADEQVWALHITLHICGQCRERSSGCWTTQLQKSAQCSLNVTKLHKGHKSAVSPTAGRHSSKGRSSPSSSGSARAEVVGVRPWPKPSTCKSGARGVTSDEMRRSRGTSREDRPPNGQVDTSGEPTRLL